MLRYALLAIAVAVTPGHARAEHEEAGDWNRLCLGIAVHRWRGGDVAGAVEALAWRDSSGVDERADFLAVAGLRTLGDRDAFLREAALFEGRDSDLARWLETLAWLDTAEQDATGERTLRAIDAARGDIEAAYARRDRHVLGLSRLEAGRTDEGRSILEELHRDELTYEGRREVARALGFLALREGRADEAWTILSELERDWRAESAELTGLRDALDEETVDRLWRRWIADAGALRLDRRPIEDAFRAFTERALDLREDADGPMPPSPVLWAGGAGLPACLPAPDSTAVAAAEQVEGELAKAILERAARARALEAARDAISRESAYFEAGSRAVDDAARGIAASRAASDSLRARSGDVAAALDRVRDEACRRIDLRTKDFARRIERDGLVAAALRHYYVDGPDRRDDATAERPQAEDVLREETALVADLGGWVATFAERSLALVRVSHETIWRPRATDGPNRLAAMASGLDQRARTVLASVDSTRAAVLDPSRLATLRAHLAAADDRARELANERTDRRRAAIAGMIDGARQSLAAEGEAIAYGLAVASHERALQEGGELALAERLRDATDRYRNFLDEYPAAPARSEIRFRLADALLAAASESAPFSPADTGPALELYLAILEDDPAWVHRDAALFHAGMILSDDGDPRARVHLQELVERFPDSDHAQGAELRLGDDLFLARDFAGCVAHFEKAATGPDPEHAAIALYKTGWAYYHRDRFRDGAEAFRRLLDLYDQHPAAARTTDLRQEAEEYLVHCLARAGGVPAFEELFAGAGRRPWEAETLERLGHLMRHFSQFDQAAAADRTWLERYPTHPDALGAAQRLAHTLERGGKPDAARAARLEWAARFVEGSEWRRANTAPEAQRAAEEFAQGAYREAALHHHRHAREAHDPVDWQRALDLYGEVVARWPDGAANPAFHYSAGEAATALGRKQDALAHFEAAAASDTASFAADAAWQAISIRDGWYEASRPAAGAPGADSLASGVAAAVDRFAERHASDPRTAKLFWRKGNLALEQGRPEQAAAAFSEIVRSYPADERAAQAARHLAQARYDAEKFAEASLAFAQAATLARQTGQDSLATALEPLVPHCSFRQAEQAQAKGDASEAAGLFEDVAERWPAFDLADQALYRAGLAYDEAGRGNDAVRVWAALIERHPQSEVRRDARLRIAARLEADGRLAPAAESLAAFAESFPEDPDAPAAILRAADLFDAGAKPDAAEELRSRYLARFPGDEEAALEILEPRARRDLLLVGPSRPISALLEPGAENAPGADLRRWLDLAVRHDSLAARDVLAEVSWHRGAEAFAAYEDVRLVQPLDVSIRTKKQRLDTVLGELRACAEYGVSPWNGAAAYRMGESLVAFGDALHESERPADLAGEDLAAYDEVLEEQSAEFFDGGEEAWTALLRRAAESGVEDEWVGKTRERLWPRMAARFLHRPEVDYPIVPIEAPEGVQ